MSEVATPIVTQLGIGGVGGFLVGYAIKKVAKIVAVILGFLILVGLYLAQTGIISLNYDRLTTIVAGILPRLAGLEPILVNIAANLPFAGSFILGFTMGLRKG